MKLQDVIDPSLTNNVVNLINACSPDDVIAIAIEDDYDEYIEIVIDPDEEECVSIPLHIAYEAEFQIYLADEVVTEASNLLECHIHVEELTVEELIAECFNYCRRHGCLGKLS